MEINIGLPFLAICSTKGKLLLSVEAILKAGTIGSKKFTKIQFISLKKVLLNWKKKYPKAKILGHRDSTETTKTCPNFDVVKWCKENLN